ncbi:hypothetical protein O0S10_08410 [Methanocorpusculum sp. MG]|uniref:Uncharacterized protein n=1 Tax=Methanocorpusculum petauri TaxID=3002863 RepID=A0ABT4IHM0_9EURY|nr:hypothetical protein [Methanocorpusculum petauri]MCZ0861239.1 hypothetical protein [Methanocorpusculum petauri]
MILHDAIVRLREVSAGAGCEDGDLRYAPLPSHHVCRYCRGRCLGVEYGGRIAEISSPDPFSAKMLLEHLFDAPLKSEKTRAAAAGALSVAAGFLMLTRTLAPCPTVNFDDCLEELAVRCADRLVYVIGDDIPGLRQALFVEEAELVVVTGDALLTEEGLAEIAEARDLEKEVLLLGPEWAGVAALLGIEHWCPYGT